jgi:hypothetical protein
MKGFCARCGEPLQDTDKVCPKCGMPVETWETKENEALEDTAEIPSVSLEETQITEEPSEEDEKIYVVEKKPSIISTILFILLVIGLLLVAAFGYCYLRNPSYIDTAFGFFGVKTNFARNVEVTGSYGKTPVPTTIPSASPSASASAAAN